MAIETQVLHFELVEQGALYRTRLSVGGEKTIEEDFDFELPEDSRLFGVARSIEVGTCSEDDLRDIGSQLWTGLTGGAIRERVDLAFADTEKFTQVRLTLPRSRPEATLSLPLLPWEALYDEQNIKFLAGHPRCCIIREPDLPVQLDYEGPDEADPIKLLVAVPEGASLRVETEIDNLKTAVSPLTGFKMLQPLRGRVTSDKLNEAVKTSRCKIFHFIGHGEAPDQEHVRLRLNQEGGGDYWIDAEPFANFFDNAGVKLAVLNCCEGGHLGPERSLSGLGRLLMLRGVPAVVAMRYAIPDDLAVKFSQAFYSELVAGKYPGRVDIALQEARQALFRNTIPDNKRGFITPLLFMAKGHEQLFKIELAPDLTNGVTARPDHEPQIDLPDGLVQAFADKRCIPIVGPNIVAASVDRRANEPNLTLVSIVEKLALEIGYPDKERLQLAEPPACWAEHVFQNVAQFFQAQQAKFKLIEAVRGICSEAKPSQAHLYMASWDVAALFYLPFDGLMEEAYRVTRQARTFCESIAAADGKPPEDHLLVQVRGTITQADTLVLTEEDHDKLAEVIAGLPARLEETTTLKLGRSVLIIGANPKDAVVRQLARKLIKPKGTQDKSFFVAKDVAEVDCAWWDSLDVEWIEADPAAVVATLSAQGS